MDVADSHELDAGTPVTKRDRQQIEAFFRAMAERFGEPAGPADE